MNLTRKMMTRLPLNQLTLNKWILYSSGGWLIGVLLVILLGTFLDNAAVGIGMGAGVGIVQWIALKQHASMKAKWFLFSIVGLGIPFLLFSLASGTILLIKPETYIPIATLLGALLAGWLQYRFILKQTYEDAANWILMNCLGWTAAAVITFVGYLFISYLPRAVSLPLAFILLVIGGPILGLISGPTILPILKRTKPGSINSTEPAGTTTVIQTEDKTTTGAED
jgi:hypothetical protein